MNQQLNCFSLVYQSIFANFIPYFHINFFKYFLKANCHSIEYPNVLNLQKNQLLQKWLWPNTFSTFRKKKKSSSTRKLCSSVNDSFTQNRANFESEFQDWPATVSLYADLPRFLYNVQNEFNVFCEAKQFD